MYLSEQFLDKVGCDFSKKSVRQALMSCELEFRKWYGDRGWEKGEGEEKLFFKNRRESVETTERFSELMDFWEVFREFSPLFTGEEKEGFFLLRAVRRADQAYHCLLNESILRRIGKDGRERLFSLCEAMGLGTGRRTVKIFRGDGEAMRLVYEMEAGEGKWEECPELSAIQNRLAEAMELGGMALVEPGGQGAGKAEEQGRKEGREAGEKEGKAEGKEGKAEEQGRRERWEAGEKEGKDEGKGGKAREKEEKAGEKGEKAERKEEKAERKEEKAEEKETGKKEWKDEGGAPAAGKGAEGRAAGSQRRAGKIAQEEWTEGQKTGRTAYLLGEGSWKSCGLRLPVPAGEEGGFEEQMARIRGEQKGAF